MSEFLGSPEKQETLKTIVKELHAGKSVAELKNLFADVIDGLSAEEIANMEQELVNEGFGVESIQQLCDVHVEVFEDELKKQKEEHMLPGHPVSTYRAENRELEKRLKQLEQSLKKLRKQDTDTKTVLSSVQELKTFEKHYQRKENQLFPKLEEVGFTGPTSVMWGKHDEIRDQLKELMSLCQHEADPKAIKKSGTALIKAMKNMIFMEEKILYPTAIRKLEAPTWARIHAEENEIGFAWVRPGSTWDPSISIRSYAKGRSQDNGGVQPPKDRGGEQLVSMNEGALTEKQLNLMLQHIPIDLTFVDEHDKVRYYSATDDRIFPRSPAIIGREVAKCHPPKSVHIVEKIVEAFKNKEKTKATFWLDFNDRKIMITYYPVFDEEGSYAGVIEFSQDITEIQKLEGEHRLLDW
ncbi:MAG: DUF438 domain-containing protein [Spirochaetota bacterium]